jgi:hypothetical protein
MRNRLNGIDARDKMSIRPLIEKVFKNGVKKKNVTGKRNR